jgi:hypothetical protein
MKKERFLCGPFSGIGIKEKTELCSGGPYFLLWIVKIFIFNVKKVLSLPRVLCYFIECIGVMVAPDRLRSSGSGEEEFYQEERRP